MALSKLESIICGVDDTAHFDLIQQALIGGMCLRITHIGKQLIFEFNHSTPLV